MYQATAKSKNQKNPYLSQKILSASPNELISYIYDAAIRGCVQNDRYRVNRAISELISALDFEQSQAAMPFFNVYRHITFLNRQGRFDEAKSILVELKNTWNRAMNIS